MVVPKILGVVPTSEINTCLPRWSILRISFPVSLHESQRRYLVLESPVERVVTVFIEPSSQHWHRSNDLILAPRVQLFVPSSGRTLATPGTVDWQPCRATAMQTGPLSGDRLQEPTGYPWHSIRSDCPLPAKMSPYYATNLIQYRPTSLQSASIRWSSRSKRSRSRPTHPSRSSKLFRSMQTKCSSPLSE